MGLVGLLFGGGCKNICEKFAERVDECLTEFCTDHPDNPMCDEANRRQGEDRGEDCPSEQHAIYELLLERSCDQLAREMGWEALNNLPLQPESPDR